MTTHRTLADSPFIPRVAERAATLVAAALVAAVVSGCGNDAGSEPPIQHKPSTVAWQPCGEPALSGLDCATLEVPKDYDAPERGRFSLALVRAAATGPEDRRIGTLFFNPGGPGVSGVDMAPDVLRAIPADIRARFHFVTWDPRGVARSSGLTGCANGSYTLPASGPVDWVAVGDRMRASEAAANRACAERHADVVPYIGTNATVRDLDALREAVGDDLLTYWGTSYGTRIGYGYAHRYPDKVRAMLITSPANPNGTWASFMEGAATSPDNAFGFFFEKQPEARTRFEQVIASLSSQPLQLPSGAQVTRWAVIGLVGSSLTAEQAYTGLAGIIGTVHTALFGNATDRAAAIASLDTREWSQEYPINGGATAFINCVDWPQRLTRAEQIALGETIRAQAPLFGFGQAMGLYYCEGVDVKPDPVPVDYLNTTTPMLVVASTRDALTQYGWANDVARNFRNSRLVTYVGTAHTPYLTARSACVDGYATDYLLTLRRPSSDAICPNAIGSY